MASKSRTALGPLSDTAQEISGHIGRYDFIAAVRRLECTHESKPRVGDAGQLRDEIVRLSQHVSLGFKGNALHSLDATQGEYDARLYINFLGLLGSNGPLPLHFTEYADQRKRHHADPTFVEFIDLFNHRLLSLFYKASVQFDPSVCFDRRDNNTYSDVIGALCGILPAASSGRDRVSEEVKRHYPGWFTTSAKSPDGIKSIVEDCFNLPVKVSEFVGGWLSLPADSRAVLGGSRPLQLGHSHCLGKRVWSRRHKFAIELGPMDWDTFQSFKPSLSQCGKLADLVRQYVGDEWDWDLKLTISAGEVQPLKLNGSRALGFDTWSVGRRGQSTGARSVTLNKLQAGLLSQQPHAIA